MTQSYQVKSTTSHGVGKNITRIFNSRDGYADFYKKDVNFFMLGPVGDKIEQWTLKGAFSLQMLHLMI